jgi:hypothetical protein
MKLLQQNKYIFLLAAIKFVLPFVLQHTTYELHRDEYLYYQQGQHLALGYLECPPLIGWLGYLSSLLGGGFFVIKFWASFVGALTVIVTAAIAKELGGKLLAQLLAGFCIIIYLRSHFLFQPNFLDIFFWSLSAFYLLRFINTQQNKQLYLLSMALALGWWSKYSVLFFIVALCIAIVCTKHRKLLLNSTFINAIFLGCILIAPNIIWQYLHNWPLVSHMSELQNTQLKYINKTDFLKEQILMLLPVAFVWISGLIWLLRNKHYRIIAFIYFGIIALLLLSRGKGYYALGAYPMLLAAGSVYIEQLQVRFKWVAVASFTIILLLFIPFVPILLPMQQPKDLAIFYDRLHLKNIGILKWEDQENHPLQQDFADMLGWQELTNKTEKFYQLLPDEEKIHSIIFCRSYGQASALKYYAKDAGFKNKVISDNGTFLLWISPELTFNHLIFVGNKMPDTDDEVFQHFAKITSIDSVTNPLSRQFGDKIIYFQNADTLAVKLAVTGLQQMKAKYNAQ